MSYYPYRYFSGANVTVELGEDDLYECAGISFMVNESNQPVYGYASTLYDGVIPGRRVIQGSFVVNFAPDDSNSLIEQIRTFGKSFIKNMPLFNIKIKYGLGSQSKSNYLLSDCFLISQGQTIQISENVILEEFSFIARDIEVADKESSGKWKVTNPPITEKAPVAAPALNPDNIKYTYTLKSELDDFGNNGVFQFVIDQNTLNQLVNDDETDRNYERDGAQLLAEKLKELYGEAERENDFSTSWNTYEDIDSKDNYPRVFLELALELANKYNGIESYNEIIESASSDNLGRLNTLLNTGTLKRQ